MRKKAKLILHTEHEFCEYYEIKHITEVTDDRKTKRPLEDFIIGVIWNKNDKEVTYQPLKNFTDRKNNLVGLLVNSINYKGPYRKKMCEWLIQSERINK